MNIIQEYEQQIIQLKNQVADLITLNERLREENNSLRAGIVQSQKEPEQKKESTTVVSKTDFPQMSAEESEKLRNFFVIHG